MPINREVKIIKVPLTDKERLPDYPKSFPSMPRLYLELLENKAKVKQDLINKEYIPNQTDNISENNKPIVESKKSYSEKAEENTEINEKNSSESVPEHSAKNRRSKSSRSSRSSRDEKISKRESESESDSESMSSESESDSESRDSNSRESKNSSHESRDSHSSRESDALSDRLKELLDDSSEKSVTRDKYSKSPKQSVENKGSHYTPYDKYKQTIPPPTLAELEAQGQYQKTNELRDINRISTTEYEDEDRKRELIFKFNLLKKSYPNSSSSVTDYTIHSDLREMQKTYETTVKQLSLDSSVENYKTYLIGGFMLVEFVFGNFLKFDMQGFTQQQIISMHSYEKLLIELGEKSYVPEGSRWPVELRLLFIIIINAGFFIVSKMIMRKTGANILNMVKNMNTANNTEPPKPKRRMRGPNINLDDIPDTEGEESEVQVPK